MHTGLSETALRDAWSRWSEHRPTDLDWQVVIELVQERLEVPVAMPSNGPKPGGQVARVQLLGPRPIWPGKDTRRPVLAEWTAVRPDQVCDVIDALTEAWGTEMIAHVAQGMGSSLELWVWRRITGE